MLGALIKTTEETQTLAITLIRRDGGTQPRQGMNEDVVTDYVAALADGAEFPPVDVMFDGTDYWLFDGFHRVEAHLRSGRAEITARVTTGTLEGAKWRSYAANQSHGLRRTTADKERAIRAALSHERAQGMSDNAIAKYLGVSDKTVTKYRSEMESTSEIPKLTIRTGADGRTRDTTNIGKRPPSEAPKPPAVKQILHKEEIEAFLWNIINESIPNSGHKDRLAWFCGMPVDVAYFAKYLLADQVLDPIVFKEAYTQVLLALRLQAAEASPKQEITLRTLTTDETMSLVWRVVKAQYPPAQTPTLVFRWINYRAWLETHKEPRDYNHELPEGTKLDGQLLTNARVAIIAELTKNLEHQQRTDERTQQHAGLRQFTLEESTDIIWRILKQQPDQTNKGLLIWLTKHQLLQDYSAVVSTDTIANPLIFAQAWRNIREQLEGLQDVLNRQISEAPAATPNSAPASPPSGPETRSRVGELTSSRAERITGLISVIETTMQLVDAEYGDLTGHFTDVPPLKRMLGAMVDQLKLQTTREE